MSVATTPALHGDIDVVHVAQRRRASSMLVVDSELRIIARSNDIDVDAIAGRLRALVDRHMMRDPVTRTATVEMFDETTALRIIDLAGESGTCFSITLERAEQRRDAFDAIASEHSLTNREREVFRMLLAGSTDGQISEHLFIAKTTATEHAKNILRKTGSARRNELFAKVSCYDGRHSEWSPVARCESKDA